MIQMSSSVSCKTGKQWPYGSILQKYLKISNFNGLSWHIQFDEETGSRTNLSFSLVDKIGNSIDIVSYFEKVVCRKIL